jgi:hypothetical protein
MGRKILILKKHDFRITSRPAAPTELLDEYLGDKSRLKSESNHLTINYLFKNNIYIFH